MLAPPPLRRSCGAVWHRALRKASRLRTCEDGFTLIEVMVVCAMLLPVLVAVLSPLDTAISVTPQDIEYTHAAQDARVGMQSMIREIRHAYNVVATTPNSITFDVLLGGNDEQVMYECDETSPTNASYRGCLRVSTATGGVLPAITSGQLVVDRLLNGTGTDPVFAYTPSPITPTYVEVQLKVPASGGLRQGHTHTITLDDGTLLRNEAIGG